MGNKILWVDDEIEALESLVSYLQVKGYQVFKANNGQSAIEIMEREVFDLLLIDQNMPGLTGIEIINKIKSQPSTLKISLISKNEQSDFIDHALANKVDDFLIKPIRPQQLEVLVKKLLHQKDLVEHNLQEEFRNSYRELSEDLESCKSFTDYAMLHKKIESLLSIYASENLESFEQMINQLKADLDKSFFKLIIREYQSWINDSSLNRPMMIHDLFPKWIIPKVKSSKAPILNLVLDNMRLDQYLILKKSIEEFYNIKEEHFFSSLLPSTTAFSRNALFSGMTPLEIAKNYPELWSGNDLEYKNKNEEELLKKLLQRNKIDDNILFEKTSSNEKIHRLINKLKEFKDKTTTVLVVNNLDDISHEIDSPIVKHQIHASYKQNNAYTALWFEFSNLKKLLKKASEKGIDLIITTDHGSTKVDKPNQIKGDRTLTNNLRYKQGLSISYNSKLNASFKELNKIGIPNNHKNDQMIFAGPKTFYTYPKIENSLITKFENTFQHGGISLDEMILAAGYFTSKKK
ncbi:MAG: response regulator [Flavobacteriaceae bacterium]